MNRYLRLYRQLLISNWNVFLAYPADALGSVISNMGWGIFSVISATLLTSQVTTVAGWSRGEIILMTATYGIIVGSFHVFFTTNLNNFGTIIHQGDLDTYLLLPISTPFLLSTMKIKFTSLLRVFASVLLAIVLFRIFPLSSSLGLIVAFVGLGILAEFLLFGLYLSVATLLLFFPDSENLMELIGVTTGTARYPSDLLRSAPRAFFFIMLPFLLIVSAPTKVLVGRVDGRELIIFSSLAVGVFMFAQWFWHFAMHWYTGASR